MQKQLNYWDYLCISIKQIPCYHIVLDTDLSSPLLPFCGKLLFVALAHLSKKKKPPTFLHFIGKFRHLLIMIGTLGALKLDSS